MNAVKNDIRAAKLVAIQEFVATPALGRDIHGCYSLQEIVGSPADSPTEQEAR